MTDASAAFVAAFAGEPAGRWAAPGRVNLIGEHTDYNDGFVLPFALGQRVVAAAARSPEPGWTVCSDFAPEPVTFTSTEIGAVQGWAAYVAGVVWALHDAGFEVPPARIAITSDVPVGAGVSSSAALESAVLTALVDLGGLDLPVAARPALAQRAENVYVGAPTGIMDQSASIRCEQGRALFLDCRTLEVEQIPFDLAAAGLAILIINSNAPHQHVDGEYGARRRSCEEAARILGVPALRDVHPGELDEALTKLDDEVMRRRVRHVVTEDQRVLDTVEQLRAGRIRGDRAADDRVARVDARRLRDHRPGGGRGGPGGAGGGRVRRPDDRRRLRRLRPGPDRRGPGGGDDGGGGAGLRRTRLHGADDLVGHPRPGRHPPALRRRRPARLQAVRGVDGVSPTGLR
nr:hypothetical protein GCM10020092_010550 [Actinoplanes digitatis]